MTLILIANKLIEKDPRQSSTYKKQIGIYYTFLFTFRQQLKRIPSLSNNSLMSRAHNSRQHYNTNLQHSSL